MNRPPMPEYAVRDVVVRPGVVLAPMEGVTNLTFRRLIRQIGGCGLTVTEFIPARNLTLNVSMALEMAMFDPDESPIAIQIYGNDPEVMAEGARIVTDLGADMVDLNMGCPSKKVCRRSGGSGLMREPALAAQIVRAMRAATPLPFTVKMRAGWDADSKNAPEIAAMCESEGAEGLTVHWRTKEDKYGGTQSWDTVAAVKDRVSVPVLANGDVIDVPSAVHALEKTGCDGLMIGRGAMRDPWVFLRLQAFFEGREAPVVDALERRRVVLGFLDSLRGVFETEMIALGRFKKVARHFVDELPTGEALRPLILRSQSVDEAIGKVERFFAALSEVQGETDPQQRADGQGAGSDEPAREHRHTREHQPHAR